MILLDEYDDQEIGFYTYRHQARRGGCNVSIRHCHLEPPIYSAIVGADGMWENMLQTAQRLTLQEDV